MQSQEAAHLANKTSVQDAAPFEKIKLLCHYSKLAGDKRVRLQVRHFRVAAVSHTSRPRSSSY